MFSPGDRVRIKSTNQTGTIAYARMAPPEYSKPEVYSVRIDRTLRGARYSGTIIKAEDVEAYKG